MKKLLSFVAGLVLAFSLSSCALSPSQQVALAGAEAGNAYATYALGQATTPAQQALVLTGLGDLASNLPLIPLGKVSPAKLGAINAELAAAKAAIGQSGNSQLASQVGSLVSLVTTAQNNAYGSVVTADQALVAAACQNVSQGIMNAIAYWQGGQSVTNPQPIPSANATGK